MTFLMGRQRIAAVTVPESPAALGYLAGLIDGEGHIGMSAAFSERGSKRLSHNCRLLVTNCDPRVMAWLLENIGGSVRLRDRGNERHRAAYSWGVYATNMEAILRAVRPYLVIKTEQADIALAFLALKRVSRGGSPLSEAMVREREGMRLRLLELNRRGPAAA